MYLEIITPEYALFEGEVSAVTFPGATGSFQVLKDHAPIISMLAPGRIKIRLADGAQALDGASGRIVSDTKDSRAYFIELKKGVVEMRNNNIIVLVD